MVIKIWLDDVRSPPDKEWIWCTTAWETIQCLVEHEGYVSVVSLDHDLGHDIKYGDGYDVVSWIERNVAFDPDFPVPELKIHSANPVGRRNMESSIKSIMRFKNSP